jgi:hypothetical protein
MPVWLGRWLLVLAPWGRTALTVIIVVALVVAVAAGAVRLYIWFATWRAALNGDDKRSERAMRLLRRPPYPEAGRIIVIDPRQHRGGEAGHSRGEQPTASLTNGHQPARGPKARAHARDHQDQREGAQERGGPAQRQIGRRRDQTRGKGGQPVRAGRNKPRSPVGQPRAGGDAGPFGKAS